MSILTSPSSVLPAAFYSYIPHLSISPSPYLPYLTIPFLLYAFSGSKDDKKAKGFAYVELASNTDDIEAIIAGMKNTEIMGRKIRTDHSVDPSSNMALISEQETSQVTNTNKEHNDDEIRSPRSTQKDTPRRNHIDYRGDSNKEKEEKRDRRINHVAATLFIGNLSYQTTEGDLRDMLGNFLGSYDNIIRINIATDRETGQSRGFAHVDFTVEADARRVFEEMHDLLRNTLTSD